MSMYLPQRVSVLALCCMAFAASAADTPRIDAEWDMRLRHEWVDDAAFAQESNASTLRMRAGLRFVGNNGWNGLVEAEGAAATGDYNSGANGRVTYPQVLDPRGVELNQAWLGWKGSNASVSLGRQRLLFDNQRWVGNVGWRQNEQTFDALAVEAAPDKDLSLRYAYLDRLHRIAGDDALDPLARERKLSTHLLHAGWKRDKQLLSGYAFLHEDRDVASASSATIGLRWAGSRSFASGTLGWSLEAARQRDYANNPLQFSHNYWLLEPVLTMQGVSVRAGWEHLGGNGNHALQTPLATLHTFNGWADKFGSTPASGLEDRYLGVGGQFGRERAGSRPSWQVAWHDYRSDHGSQHYGSEWDASLSVPVAQGISAMVKLADYRADAFARDTRKLWLQLEYKGKH